MFAHCNYFLFLNLITLIIKSLLCRTQTQMDSLWILSILRPTIHTWMWRRTYSTIPLPNGEEQSPQSIPSPCNKFQPKSVWVWELEVAINFTSLIPIPIELIGVSSSQLIMIHWVNNILEVMDGKLESIYILYTRDAPMFTSLAIRA